MLSSRLSRCTDFFHLYHQSIVDHEEELSEELSSLDAGGVRAVTNWSLKKASPKYLQEKAFPSTLLFNPLQSFKNAIPKNVEGRTSQDPCWLMHARPSTRVPVSGVDLTLAQREKIRQVSRSYPGNSPLLLVFPLHVPVDDARFQSSFSVSFFFFFFF